MAKPEPAFTNNLINAASPYLLQHAHNPVDWLEWGEQAFEKARRDDKPVFLSIGYSTCHWCHVMAHESFEKEHIAAILNEQFVSIKVDREELPGVDAVYMDFVQKTTGSGGWPLTVFLTPDGKPFYGGTYFPPRDAYGRPGFENLLRSVAQAWAKEKDKLLQSADDITAFLQPHTAPAERLTLGRTILDDAAAMLEQLYDPRHGGFAGAPKFPQPGMLTFLMAYSRRTADSKWLDMVSHTLDRMAAGGIHDHLGGGFHRYAVDEQWRVPHFEKMLYDQALIGRAYTQAYQLTGRPIYQNAACDIFDYVLRALTAPDGGFYSAEDADSEGVEGLFYVWTAEQLNCCLPPDQAALAAAYYGVTTSGNVEDGTSILHVTRPLSAVAHECGIQTNIAEAMLAQARQMLFAAREKRIRPHRDEKIITGWNGLMISALAGGGAAFDNRAYIDAAQRCAAFILQNLYRDGRLKRYYGAGQARRDGVLDDYAFFIRGLIDLYQADFDPQWLRHAVELAEQMCGTFEDNDTGGFYLTGVDSDTLVVRTRPEFDGAIPSGNSAAAMELLRLAELTGEKKWVQPAERIFAVSQEELKKQPVSLTDMLTIVDFGLGPRSEIVIAAGTQDAETRQFINQLRRRFLPRTVVLLRDEQNDTTVLEQIAQPVRDRPRIDGKPTVYLCENFTCREPITDIETFRSALDQLR